MGNIQVKLNPDFVRQIQCSWGLSMAVHDAFVKAIAEGAKVPEDFVRAFCSSPSKTEIFDLIENVVQEMLNFDRQIQDLSELYGQGGWMPFYL